MKWGYCSHSGCSQAEADLVTDEPHKFVTLFGDLEGDGQTDIVFVNPESRDIFYARGLYTAGLEAADLTPPLGYLVHHADATTWVHCAPEPDTCFRGATLTDINGDRRLDVLISYSTHQDDSCGPARDPQAYGHYVRFAYALGTSGPYESGSPPSLGPVVDNAFLTGHSYFSQWLRAMDINGDARNDSVLIYQGRLGTPEPYTQGNIPFGRDIISSLSVSGNDLQTLLTAQESDPVKKAHRHSSPTSDYPPHSFWAFWDDHVGDVNGDAMDDLVHAYRGYSGSYLTYFLGTRFGELDGPHHHSANDATLEAWLDGLHVGFWRSSLADINGDGRSDLVWTQLTETPALAYALGNDNGFGPLISHSGGAGAAFNHSILHGDLNGDGKQDVILANNGRIHYLVSRPGTADLLVRIDTPMGGMIAAEYTNAADVENAIRPAFSDASVCGGGQAPRCGIPNTAARPLLTRVVRDNGKGFSSSKTISYRNGRIKLAFGTVSDDFFVHPLFRFDFGFGGVTITDEHTGEEHGVGYLQSEFASGLPTVEYALTGGADIAIGELHPYRHHTTYEYDVYSSLNYVGKSYNVRQTLKSTTVYQNDFSAPGSYQTHIYTDSETFTYGANLLPVGRQACVGLYCLQYDIEYDQDLTLHRFGRISSIRVREPSNNRILDWRKMTYEPGPGGWANLQQVKRILFYDADDAFCPQSIVESAHECTEAITADKAEWVNTLKNADYDIFGNLLSTTDAHNNITERSYDSATWTDLHELTNSLWLAQTIEYDENHNIRAASDENGMVTHFDFDSFGRLRSIQRPRSSPALTAEIKYADWETPEKAIDTITWAEPNVSHSKIAKLDGFGAAYETHELIGTRSVVSTRGQRYASSVAPTKLVVSETEPAFAGDHGILHELTYDSAGRPEKVERYVYDSGSNSYQLINTVAQYQYGVAGNPNGTTVTTIDAAGKETRRHYDVRNKLVRVVDAEQNQINYTYDIAGRLRSVALKNGDSETLDYDSWGRVRTHTQSSAKRPTLGTTTYIHDYVGNILQTTDASSNVVSYEYDELYRPRFKHTSEGTTTFNYDDPLQPYGRGRLTSIVYPSGSVSFVYDAEGNVEYRTETIDGYPDPLVFSYQYDFQSRITERVSPTGASETIAYSPEGLLSSISYGAETLVAHGDFDAQRRPGRIETANAVLSFPYFDAESRLRGLTTIRATTSEILQDYEYGYDKVGNLEYITDLRNPPTNAGINTSVSAAFTYDDIHRLQSVVGTNLNGVVYGYDSVGDMESENTVEHTYSSCSGGRCLTASQGSTILWRATFGARGLRTKFEIDGVTWDYTYDDEERLTAVSRNGTPVGEYFYDPFGRRIKKVAYDSKNGIWMRTIYAGGNFEVHTALIDPSKHSYVTSLGNVASLVEGQIENQVDASAMVCTGKVTVATGAAPPEGLWFHHGDRLGTREIVTNDLGNSATRILHEPFGALREEYSVGYDAFARKFGGGESDPETGLIYLNARYYDPITKRFMTPDTVVPGQGLRASGFNRYAYSRNNPLRFVDPSGSEERPPDTEYEGGGNTEIGSFDYYVEVYWDQPLMEVETWGSTTWKEFWNWRREASSSNDMGSLDLAGNSERRAMELELLGENKNYSAGLQDFSKQTAPMAGKTVAYGADQAAQYLLYTVLGAVVVKFAEPARELLAAVRKGTPDSLLVKNGVALVADTHVYLAMKGENVVGVVPVYVGNSKDVMKRELQHIKNKGVSHLVRITDEPLTNYQARAIEQVLIERNEGFLNLRNSIAEDRSFYKDALAWGTKWLNASGLGL
jgi:RHS repeat-associated protein